MVFVVALVCLILFIENDLYQFLSSVTIVNEAYESIIYVNCKKLCDNDKDSCYEVCLVLRNSTESCLESFYVEHEHEVKELMKKE